MYKNIKLINIIHKKKTIKLWLKCKLRYVSFKFIQLKHFVKFY